MGYTDFGALALNELTAQGGYDCACSKHHEAPLKFLRVAPGAVAVTPEALAAVGSKKPYIVCDENTKKAAADRVCEILRGAGVDFTLYVIPAAEQRAKPSEWELGGMAMSFDPGCDFILGVGSGVVNDLCKMLGLVSGLSTGIVGAAPSMDGYASNSSSMEVRDVKTTIYNKTPSAIILDTEILAAAPMRMLWAGLGDMLAKHISVCEWRIASLVTGEYYCENVANIMRSALAKVTAAAPGLARRDLGSVQAVAEGLVAAGIAMAYAGVSRPASGLEHYFSHMWEMMALERKKPYDLHGIQVGVGTLLTLKIYDRLRALSPDEELARRSIESFDEKKWEENVRRVFGATAPEIFAIERKCRKNAPENALPRMEAAIKNWDGIMAAASELPSYEEVRALMRSVGMPLDPEDIGIDRRDTADAFVCSRDMRDKYLTSSLLWDLGVLDDFARSLE